MPYQEFVKRSVTFIALVALAVFLVLVLGRISSVLQIAFACWVLSVVIEVPVSRLRALGLRRGVAILVTVIGLIMLVLLLGRLILPSFVTQIGNLINELPNAVEAVIGFYGETRQTSEFLAELLPPFTMQDYEQLIDTTLANALHDAGATVDLQDLANSTLPVILGAGSFLGNIVLNLVLVFFITMYLLLDPMVYYRALIALLPAANESRAVEILNEIRRNVVAWLGALSVSVTVTAILVMIGLGVILRVPNAVALGVLAGLGNIIPYIGYYAALIPIAIYALASAGPGTMVLAIIIYFVVGEIENKLVTPTVVRHELNIPAGLILLFQIIAGALMGFLGILLAVPILAILITLVRELYVYDGLGKKGRVTKVVEGAGGQLALALPVVEETDVEAPAVQIEGEGMTGDTVADEGN